MKDTRIRLIRRSALQQALEARAEAWFAETGRSPRGGARLARKTAFILGWFAASYALVLSGAGGWPGLVLGAISLGLATAGIGFDIMHDGGHKAVANSKLVNRAMHFTLDLVGGSSYIWSQKHNVMHHTYPNVVGADDDIDVAGLARMAPQQPHHAAHRWQHLYMWPLYGMISIKWHWYDDFVQLARGKLLEHRFPRPRGSEIALLVAGKIIFFAWAVVTPLLVLGWARFLTYYFLSQCVLGVTLAVVFQLAHCVEDAEFTALPPDGPPVELDYARLQLDSTVDFARGNRFVTWYVGGLNYQVVHHLFPRVSHVHYPDLSPIVAEVCAEFGVRYRTVDSVRAAIGSHYRWLRRMGREPTPEVIAAAA